jgi:hypothetical protein
LKDKILALAVLAFCAPLCLAQAADRAAQEKLKFDPDFLKLELTELTHVSDSDAPDGGNVRVLSKDWESQLKDLAGSLSDPGFSDEDVAVNLGNLMGVLKNLNYCGGLSLAKKLIPDVGIISSQRTAALVQKAATGALIDIVDGKIEPSVSCEMDPHPVYDTTSAPMAAIGQLDQIFQRNASDAALQGQIVTVMADVAATNPDSWISLRAFRFLKARAPDLVAAMDSRRRSLNLPE